MAYIVSICVSVLQTNKAKTLNAVADLVTIHRYSAAAEISNQTRAVLE